MANKKREKADPPPSPPQPLALTLPSPLSIKLEPETGIRVSILPPEKLAPKLGREMILLAATFFSLTSVWAILFWTHVVRQIHSQPVAVSGTPLSATMTHPARVAFGDEAEIEITVVNNGVEAYSGNLTLTFQGDAPANPLPNETTSIEIKNLIAKASATYRVKFTLGEKSWTFGGGAIRASLQAYSDARPIAAVPGSVIPIARLPYARSLILWFSKSSLTLAAAALLWEMARKFVFKWEAKG